MENNASHEEHDSMKDKIQQLKNENDAFKLEVKSLNSNTNNTIAIKIKEVEYLCSKNKNKNGDNLKHQNGSKS